MAQVGMMGRNGMDDMRDEAAADERERMIETIMECEGVSYADACALYDAE
ncbi:hypothetical protein BcepSauron_053 [Burkholderia phage BcepSauron]|nr:hypothetical protein H1O17_gp053 [Burkholderia phage BcepSauron]QBQ74433.1 hypothetical protein BcepSauron_053 [Burkholderia phage BcepSauron]